MKNKTFYCTLLILTAFIFASCSGSRQGYGNHRKGYGCPATVSIHSTAEKDKV
ncbi:MAG: hypothetical protein ACXWV0_07150 [Flavisolibacter sp.]